MEPILETVEHKLPHMTPPPAVWPVGNLGNGW